LTIITGGQTGVDRASLDIAGELSLPYAGWCPRGGWAEDLLRPPGLLTRYPHLRETPLADPAQRTEWNVRDSDAVLILAAGTGIAASRGTALAADLAVRYRKPLLVVDLDDTEAVCKTTDWLDGLMTGARHEQPFRLGVGGPRESEAPGIYNRAVEFLRTTLRGAGK
jgi:hypothetical protein